MQKTLLLPIRFLIYFIASVTVMLLFSLLFHWSETFAMKNIPGEVFFRNLPTALLSIIFPAVSSALLFSFFSKKNIRLSVAAYLITTALVFVILFLSYRTISTFTIINTEKVYKPLSNNSLQITKDYIIYSDKVSIQNDDVDVVNGLIIKKRDAQLPGFKYYYSAQLYKKNNPRLKINNEKIIEIDPPNPVFDEVFKPDKFLQSALKSIGYFGQTLSKASQKEGVTYLLYIIAAAIFLMSCMLIKNTSRWPLLEISEVISLHIIVYFLFALFSKQSDFITNTFLKGIESSKIPLLLLFIITAIILLFCVFIRLSNGKRTT